MSKHPPKIYKFRSLADETSLHRAKEILETGKLHCSKYWELNDPMEGVYRWLKKPGSFVQDLRHEKLSTLIACVSGPLALRRHLMWGHYANGFNGVAIEFKPEGKDCESLHKIKYDVKVPKVNDGKDAVTRVFTSKLKAWAYEKEWRLLKADNGDRKMSVGTISAVYVGRVYPKTATHANCPPSLQAYYHRRSCLIATAASKEDRCL
jgi:hypothetical protein